jgi:histidine triad (HIT) family protein
MDCIFCKIVAGEIPTEKVKENDDILVIKDINPKASIHFLLFPKKHVEDIMSDDGSVWSSIGKLAKEIAKEQKVSGFRLVNNAGAASLVKHMHVHFLGEVGQDREL